MLQWEDEGLLLKVAPMAESHLILEVLSKNHGRWRGCLPRGRRIPGLQSGNLATLTWQARLEDQLGRFSLEITKDLVSRVLFERRALSLLQLVCSFLSGALSERQAYPALYDLTTTFLTNLGDEIDLAAYVQWEIHMLRCLGFGLDLSRCVVTESTQDLIWVSPRSASAVSRDAGRGYESKLLPLPPFLIGAAEPTGPQLLQALNLTGYFLGKHFDVLPFFKGWAETRSGLITSLAL